MSTRADLPAARIRSVGPSEAGLDVVAFLLPGLSFWSISLGGQLIVSEVLAIVALPWLWTSRDRIGIPKWFVLLWAGWLGSQVVTDLVDGSQFVDLARGWAAILLTLTNFAAIAVLVATPRRARIFALGLAVGGVLGYVLVPNAYASDDPWKWAFALPVGFSLAATLSAPACARRPWLAVAAFAAFGIANMGLGFRSLAGVSLLTAGYIVLSVLARSRSGRPSKGIARPAGGLLFVALAVIGALNLYDFAASEGLLGPSAQAKYVEQSGSLGVVVGGRSEVLASTQAIVDSPILGHGSWPKDYKYVDLQAELASSLGYEIGADYTDIGLIPTHSYLTGAWVWAGLLGGLFWLAILGRILWLLGTLYSVPFELKPLVVFSAILLAWDILFSPYGFTARIEAPFSIALCLLALRAVSVATGDEGRSQPGRESRAPGAAASRRRSGGLMPEQAQAR